jgi:hypothetical protein
MEVADRPLPKIIQTAAMVGATHADISLIAKVRRFPSGLKPLV